MEEPVAKSPISDYFGFNRGAPTRWGWCLNSQLFQRYWAKSKIIPDFLLSPFHSLIYNLKIFPSTALTQNQAHEHGTNWYYLKLNMTVASPSRVSAIPGYSGPILANCWGGTCQTRQVQHVTQIATVPETTERETTLFHFTLFSLHAIEYKFSSVFLAPGEALNRPKNRPKKSTCANRW